MSLLLRALLHRRHLLLAPAGVEGGGGGGAGAEDDDTPDDEADGSEGEETSDGADEGDDDEDPDAKKGDGAADDDDAGEDGGTIISLGDPPEAEEEDEHRAPNWVRDLRKSNREKDRRIRELEGQVAAAKPAAATIEVGNEPDPKDYEMWEPEQAAKFKADLLAWTQRKTAADAEQSKRQQAQETAQREWTDRLKAVDTAGAALKQADHDDAVEALADVFSVAQMGMLIDAAADATKAAQLRYALGKDPKEAARLAAIQHPVKFIAEITRLEAKLKVTPRKAAPPAESQLRSSGGGSKASAVDNVLERARAEARKTGDYSQVMALRRQQQERAKKRA